MTFRQRNDRGSTVPLILGLFLVALVLVAGSVAAGDAFVQQRQLQDLCDGAAVAAAGSGDVDGGRHSTAPATDFLVLGSVQAAVDRYRDRDQARAGVTMQASLAGDGVTVSVRCAQRRSIAFGSWFGYSDGVAHQATSTARGRLRA